MTLLARVSAVLETHGAPYAMIGAAALAAHGVTRATADLDLLTADARCLDAGWWASLATGGSTVDVRRGDAGDPLAGVVRVSTAAGDEAPVDVMAGRARWQEGVVACALRTTVEGANVPIVRAEDLVLLKLYAGGPQDAWDVDQLLDAVPAIEPVVEARLGELPTACAALWRRIVDARRKP